MDRFFSLIEYFQEELMGQKDVKPSSIKQTEPEQHLVTTEVVEAVSSVPDQVKFVCKWRGTCKLSNSANPSIITDNMGTSSYFTKHLLKMHRTNKEYMTGKVNQSAKKKKKTAPQELPGQLTLATGFSSVPNAMSAHIRNK